MVIAETNPNTIRRFEECGKTTSIVVDVTNGKHELRVFTCGQRLCPICQYRRRSQLEDRLTETMPPFKEHEWKFITLTVRSNDFPLKVQLDLLVHAFRSLRRRMIWQRHCDYGWGVLEVTYNAKTGKWHPHLHLIAHCSFWAHNSLSKAWCESTRGSSVCDIRPIGSGVARVKYVTKYIGKPPDFNQSEDPTPLIVEYYRAMKHRRMLIKFGNHPKRTKPAEDPSSTPERSIYLFVMVLDQLVDQVRTGRKESIRILHEVYPDSKHPIYAQTGIPPP